MADALKHNNTLEFFEFNASVDNETRVAMADGLKHNDTLKSCKFDVSDTSIDNVTGVARAGAFCLAWTTSRNFP